MSPDPTASRTTAVVWLQRLAVLLCLGSAYQCAVTGFEAKWLGLLVVTTLVVATAHTHWLPGDKELHPLSWPPCSRIWSHFVPGWLLMTVAAIAKLVGVAPQAVIWMWLGGAIWTVTGACLAAQQGRGKKHIPGFQFGLGH